MRTDQRLLWACRLPGGRRSRCFLSALLLAFLMSGCAALRTDFADVERELARGNPERALAQLEPLAGSRLNQPLYQMNRGMILRLSGDLPGSIAAFEEAKALVGELQAVSVSETLASWTLTETATSYVPPTHEHLMLHVFQALNHLQLGDLDSARVEALQIDLGLRRIDPLRNEAPHGGDAFARYISGVIFEANEDWSDAMIAYRKAYQAYQRHNAPVPGDLQRSLVRLADHLELDDERDELARAFGITAWTPVSELRRRATVLLVVQDGLAPRLRDESLLVQDPGSGQLIRVALPSLHRRPSSMSGAVLSANGQQAPVETAERLSDISDQWLQRQMPLLIARAASRNVARYQATRQVREESPLLAVLVNVVGAVMDNADTRSWRTLPDRIQVARLHLPPGEHTLVTELRGPRGVRDEETIRLRAGQLVVLNRHWIEAR